MTRQSIARPTRHVSSIQPQHQHIVPITSHTPNMALTTATPPQHLTYQPPPPPLTIPSNPVPGLPFSPLESLYFSLFRTETLSGLAGLFDSSSWRQRVLQDCHADPAIRHAAVALGALFKTLEQSSRTPSPTGRTDDADAVRSHWRVAVQYYSLACNAIAVSSPGEDDGGSSSRPSHHRTRLLVSTLLGTFDAFIGDHRQAIVQIQNGLSLMERLSSPATQETTDLVEGDLAVVFTRLAISAKSYDLAFHFPDPYVIRLTPHDEAHHPRKTPFSDPVPPGHRFTTLREARLAHEGTLDRGIRFLERLQAAQNHAMGFFPRDWERYGAAYVGELTSWAAAFSPLFASRLEDMAFSPRDRTAIATLQMEHINARVLFLSLFSSSETAFDTFIPQFATIVELAREVVTADEAAALTTARCPPPPSQCAHYRWDDVTSVINGGYAAYHLKPSFTADLGIVPPLFMVATKCREPTLRRQAISLLRSSARREGMWDSELVARIGTWIMELEESSSPSDHLGQPTTIPEEARVMIHAVDFDLRSRTAELTVGTRNMKPGDERDPRYQMTHISW